MFGVDVRTILAGHPDAGRWKSWVCARSGVTRRLRHRFIAIGSKRNRVLRPTNIPSQPICDLGWVEATRTQGRPLLLKKLGGTSAKRASYLSPDSEAQDWNRPKRRTNGSGGGNKWICNGDKR